MNGIRLFGIPLRLKDFSGSGNVEALKPSSSVDHSAFLPPRPQPSFCHPPAGRSHSGDSGRAGLMRSSSEPEWLGRWHDGERTHRVDHGRAPVPYPRPHGERRFHPGFAAPNSYRSAVPRQSMQPARNFHPSTWRHHNSHMHSGFQWHGTLLCDFLLCFMVEAKAGSVVYHVYQYFIFFVIVIKKYCNFNYRPIFHTERLWLASIIAKC